MSNAPADQMVWIDCEMTGLDIERDGLCEIAVIVTDFDLEPLHPGFEIVIDPGAEALAGMGDFVRKMHTESGLLPRIADGVSVEEAERRTIAYVSEHVAAGRRPIVAGNTIGMDRRFIAKYMPRLDARMHYRSIDVSTIKELARQWYPAAFYGAPGKHGGHRALADIAESIRELAYFRSAVLIPGPGPDKAAAEHLAQAAESSYEELIRGEA
ncbi:oligoribonuclease [Leucobacter weissii]|uniref:Oligoribonuclease n=1 Tax=Leucobacter weissii TaxID=1983706 RepID=A0A939ML11_9MICO|nr:oligoribonuclease [Leucobacter weissii]MBO1902924.1 oligoribonuclease [Leucobacter weissii]